MVDVIERQAAIDAHQAVDLFSDISACVKMILDESERHY